MLSPSNQPIVRIAPNSPVFDLPAIVGIEEGLFEAAGLDVAFSASYADREKAGKTELARETEVLRQILIRALEP